MDAAGVQIIFRIRQLNDNTFVDHCNAVADETHYAQIVRDKQIGQAVLLLQLAEQVENLRTN